MNRIFSTPFHNEETVSRMCSVKKVFLEISQNSQESTCARVSFLIKLQVSGAFRHCKETQILIVNFVLQKIHHMNPRTNGLSDTGGNNLCSNFLQINFTSILCPQCYVVDVCAVCNSLIGIMTTLGKRDIFRPKYWFSSL